MLNNAAVDGALMMRTSIHAYPRSRSGCAKLRAAPTDELGWMTTAVMVRR